MGLLGNLFGVGKPATDFKQLKADGALIIDVRSEGEYRGGHLAGSRNIPLDKLPSQLQKLPLDKVIITCCASGMRSGSAKALLERAGYTAYNGGGWTSLARHLDS